MKKFMSLQAILIACLLLTNISYAYHPHGTVKFTNNSDRTISFVLTPFMMRILGLENESCPATANVTLESNKSIDMPFQPFLYIMKDMYLVAEDSSSKQEDSSAKRGDKLLASDGKDLLVFGFPEHQMTNFKPKHTVNVEVFISVNTSNKTVSVKTVSVTGNSLKEEEVRSADLVSMKSSLEDPVMEGISILERHDAILHELREMEIGGRLPINSFSAQESNKAAYLIEELADLKEKKHRLKLKRLP